MSKGLICAYAGVPIVTADGIVIAVLCVVDNRPRAFSTAQVDALEHLADTARAILTPLKAAPPARPRVDVDEDPAGSFESKHDDLYLKLDRTIPELDDIEKQFATRGRWTSWISSHRRTGKTDTLDRRAA